MQWRHNIRLQAAYADYWFACKDVTRAEHYAHELLNLATMHQCRKYICHAHKTLAEIAVGRGQLDAAEGEFQKAISLLQQYPAPLLAWKTYASFARFSLGRGDSLSAGQSFDAAAAIIKELAANVEEEQLRQTFLTSSPVREVLENAHA
jgi:tetratricopeptide (TPR) repeat protein